MDTISFNQFYKNNTIIHCYESDGKKYIDSDNLKDIIDRLESIKTNIEKEIDNNLEKEIDNNLEQNFRESLKFCKFRNDDKKCAKLANINSDYCNIHKSFAKKGEEDDLLKMIGIALEDDIDEDDIDEDDIDEDDIDEDDIDEDDIDEDDIDEDKSVYYIKYLESMIGFVKRELKLNYYLKNTLIKFTNGDKSSCNKYIDSAKYILTEELNIIPVISARRYISFNNVGIFLNSNKKDYTGNKQELLKLIQEKENDKIIDDESEEEHDNRILIQRQLVLKFEHPIGYINEFGDYNYDKFSIIDGLYNHYITAYIEILARSFMFRSKTRRHFEYLNRAIPYEYTEMKESRKLLHSELRSLYKIFRRRMVDIPLAIAIKNE